MRVCKALFALLHVVCTIFSTHDGASQFQHPHATLMVNAVFIQFTSLIALALASIYDALEQKGSRNRTVALPIFLNILVCIFAHYISTIRNTHKLATNIHHQGTLYQFAEGSLGTIDNRMLVLACQLCHTFAGHDAIIICQQYRIILLCVNIQRIKPVVYVVEAHVHTFLTQYLTDRVTLAYRNPNTFASSNTKCILYIITACI